MSSSQPFYIGEWRVEPSTNRLSRGEEEVLISPKAMLALQLLADDPMQPKSHDQLMATIWGEQIVSEASLYQLIAQLRKSLGDTESPRQYIEKVSGKGYRLIAEVTSEQENPNSFWHRWWMRKVWLVPIALILIVLEFSNLMHEERIDPKVQEPKQIADIQSILFTSFQSYQDSGVSEYVINGLNDSVLARLSELQDLKVINYRNSVPADDLLDISEINTVDAALLGFVQKEEGSFRVAIQIYDSKSAELIWTKIFDGDDAKLFALQDRITESLANQLKRKPISVEPVYTVTDQVYQDYLLGRFYWSQRKLDSLNKAENIFNRITRESPEFPLAYVGLCDTFVFYSIYSNWPSERSSLLCEPLLEKALSLNPKLGPAYASQAKWLATQGKYNEARSAYESAIRYSPNYAITYLWYGDLLRNLGEVDKAYTMIQKGFELDPLSPIVNRQLAFTFLNLGRFHDAARAYERALALESDYTDRPVDELNFFPLNVKRAADFLRWAEDNPQRITHIDVHKLPYTAVLMSVGKIQDAEKALSAYGEKFSGHQFFLFLQAAMAIEKQNQEQALEYLKDRAENYGDNPNLSNSYIGALSYFGYKAEALKLFKTVHAIELDRGIKSIGLSENNYRRWLFYDELLTANNIEGDLGFRAEVNAYMLKNFNPENIYHLIWMERNGKAEEAKQLGRDLLKSGWLPDHNNEFLSKERFRDLYQDDEEGLMWFDGQVKLNQSRALELFESR